MNLSHNTMYNIIIQSIAYHINTLKAFKAVCYPYTIKLSNKKFLTCCQYITWKYTNPLLKLTFPFSASLFARIHSTRLRRSLQDIVWILLGKDSSCTFLENKLTANARSLNDRLWRTWWTKSASVLYASGLSTKMQIGHMKWQAN